MANHPYLPEYTKPSRAVLDDRTSSLAIALAEGRVSHRSEPWYANFAHTYGPERKPA